MAGAGPAVDQVFLMVVLSLVLEPRANRITNIAMSLVYAATILDFSIGETWAYCLIGSLVDAPSRHRRHRLEVAARVSLRDPAAS